MTLHSTINDYAYYNPDENDAEGDPEIDPLIDSHTSDGKKRKVNDTNTTNRNYPQKLLINRTLPIIIPLIDLHIADGVAAGIGTTHAHQTSSSKMIVTDAAHSGARVFRTPRGVSRTGRDGTTPWDGNTSKRSLMFNYLVLIGGGTTVSPNRTGSQEIISPKGPTGPVEVRNAQIFHTSIHGDLTKNGDPKPTLSKVIGRKLSHNYSTDIY